MARCASCNAAVVWVVTEAGKRMPVDAVPSDKGNLILRDGKALHESKVPEAERPAERYTSHFATCPQGEKWRRRSS